MSYMMSRLPDNVIWTFLPNFRTQSGIEESKQKPSKKIKIYRYHSEQISDIFKKRVSRKPEFSMKSIKRHKERKRF